VPSTVAGIFAAADAAPAGVVRWGAPPALPRPANGLATGMYVVALTERPDSTDGALADAPISARAVAELLAVRPELRLDGARPTVEQLAARLGGFWFPDEVVVYIGLAGPRKPRPAQGELANRVGEYYSTPLGASSKHRGGWPLKTLACLSDLYVHYAYCDDMDIAETAGIRRFASHVSDGTRAQLYDSVRVMPFANLEFPKGNRKGHGIRGASAPKRKAPAPVDAAPPVVTPTTTGVATAAARPLSLDARALTRQSGTSSSPSTEKTGASRPQHVSLTVTEKDIEAGQVRVSAATKTILPSGRAYLSVVLRGLELTCRWDPRDGPPPRSGVIRVGKAAAREMLTRGETLTVAVDDTEAVMLG
jgi:hypothetical protein